MMSMPDVYAPDLHATTRENLFYTLVMFPYPSGYGLHVGHASNFVINDVLARYKRLKGYTVFNPFGFDSFGLPTENYAMKLGKPAYEVTEDNIKYYSSQVAALDLSFDTERTVVTSRPDYYKRTQWIFQQLYKAGLAYRDTLRVNWCPECQTVLANDQVIEGTCERCKSEIIQKKHPQWFIKITAYAEKLLTDLDLVDRPEETKLGQKNWIGKSEGVEIIFKISDDGKQYQRKDSCEWSIREFESNDKEAIFRLYGAAFGNEKRGSVYNENYIISHFNDWIQSPTFTGLVCSGEQKLYAYLFAYAHSDMVESMQEMGVLDDISKLFSRDEIDLNALYRLDDLVVDHQARNQGIGTRLLYTFEQMMSKQKINYIACLTLADDNSLLNFYRSRGYVSLGIIEDQIAHKEYNVFVKKITEKNLQTSCSITVFTTRPDTIYGVTALVLAPENTLLDELLAGNYKTEVEEYRQITLAKTAVQRQKDLKEKTGVFSGVYAVHPLTGEQVPVWYADYVLPDYGTGAVMMVPAHDARDFEFAQKFSIPVKKVIARETGQKRDNEEFKDGGAAIIFDPKTQKYAVAQRPDERISLFAGGVAPGESVYEAILREVQEESGLYDFAYIEWIETSYAHYFNQAKQVNRVARAECLLIILGSSQTNEVALEYHETFHLARKSPEEIKTKWQSANKEGHYDHYVRFLDESVARTCALGYDTTSNKDYFVSTAMTEYGILEQSAQFTGLTSGEAKKKIAEHLESIGAGRKKISYKLRDRSVSRQRYRGSPIPVYYDENNTPHLIPEEELPVMLPLDLENYKPTGKSPLEDHPTFPLYSPQNTKVPFQKWTRGVRSFHEGKEILTRKTILAILHDPKKDVYGIISWLGLGQDNYTFVLGGVDEGENSEDAAYREVYEETGYKHIRLVKKLGEFQTEFWHAVKKRNQHNITDAFLFELVNDERDVGTLEENENIEFVWMTKEQILDNHQHEALRNYYLSLACGDDFVRTGEWIEKYNTYNPLPIYRRECDTLDTFMCSSFYFLRYPDANNPNMLSDSTLLNKCFPIDFYIGGKEHTVGHLLYARFIHKFLYDQGYVSCSEPFQRLVHQGMVLGADGRKMSKRWGNVIDPMEVIEKYCADAVRTYLMFMGPVEQEKVWNDGALAGVAKFLGRIKNIVHFLHTSSNNMSVERALHKAIKGVGEDMEKLKYNTAVSKLMILLNSIEEQKSITSDQFSSFLIMLFSFAPQTSRQIWTDIGLSGMIDEQVWPLFDVQLTIDETISLPIQINGKVRVNLTVSPELSEEIVLELALQEDQIKKYVAGNQIKKVIYVPGKILNIVI